MTEEDQQVVPVIGSQILPRPMEYDPLEGTSRQFEQHFTELELTAPRPGDQLAGAVEYLQMINFMCHSNLELKLNKRINFITGRNGSGKSAIMTALTVALGGTAALTGRGAGISDFIKKGETWARVHLTLINQGVNAYKKDIYGQRIIIVRNLSKSSSSSYVIKSESGAVVSRKKEEIDHIVLSFNLQIKNPICLLNQDLARSFLCCSDDSVRFGIFARATQLEFLKTMYSNSLSMLMSTKQNLQGKEKGIQEAGREIAIIKEKLSIFASLEKHVHERTQFENEYVWALVADEERKLQKLTEDKDDVEKVKIEYLEKERNFEESINQMKGEIEELVEKSKSLKMLASEKSEEIVNVMKEIQNVEKEAEKAETQVESLEAKIEKLESDTNGVKEHLAQCDTESGEGQEERNAVLSKTKALMDEWEELKHHSKITQDKANEVQETKFDQMKALETLKSELNELDREIKQKEILLSGARAKKHNNLLRYGPKTPELVAAINEASAKDYFVRKPVGPCGLYVNLIGDDKWATVAESVVGTLMSTYCCDNQRDYQVLTRIIERVCGSKQPSVIIGKFAEERHNVEKKKARAPGVLTLLDVLSFESDVVFNTFIDQARIETILLFESDQQAASLMSHVKSVPQNARMGLTVFGDQYYPSPNYRTYYGNPKRSLRFFDKTLLTEDSIRKLEDELRIARAEVQNKGMEILSARREYMYASETLRSCEKMLRDYRHKEKRIQLELNQLKDLEESRPMTVTKVALREELKHLEEAMVETKEKVSETKALLENLVQKKNELMAHMKSLEADEKQMEAEVNEALVKVEERKYKIKQTNAKKTALKKDVVKFDRKLVEINEEMEKVKECLEKNLKAAEDVCPNRIDTSRTALEVQNLLEKCERYLRTAEKMTGSRQRTIYEYKTKIEVYNLMQKNEEVLSKTLDSLTKIAIAKEQRLVVLQSHTASLVSLNFQATLQTRGYDGQLKIDFENKLLEIEVRTKDVVPGRKDPKTLSGGERSYSTVSFILAIWKVVHMPIYFLDEFDVFMDKVNRKVIMDLLMEHARAHNQQFVFITPQDLPSLKSSEDVSVFKLPDPERRSDPMIF